MGEPAADKTAAISESLEEINQQMEELNISEDARDSGAETAAQDAPAGRDDLSLNAESPPDAESLQNMASNETASVQEKGPEGSTPEQGADSAPQGSSMDDDETGIDLGDDELWEDDDIEEIPLFEEEFLEQELEPEAESKTEETGQPLEKKASKKEKEEKPETPSEENAQEENSGESAAEEGPEDTGSSEVEAAEDETSQESREGSDEQPPEESREASAPEVAGIKGLIPWIVTGLSAGLCVAAVFTIWLMASSADKRPANPAPVSSKNQQKTMQVPAESALKLAKSPARGTAQAIDLAPFLIPAQKSGDLVFFKLRIELIVPDATTKQELLKREAWVRDIIYQELKGINISRGVKGDLLTRYRRPLLDRLNKELAPLRLEDIRLMGFLLR